MSRVLSLGTVHKIKFSSLTNASILMDTATTAAASSGGAKAHRTMQVPMRHGNDSGGKQRQMCNGTFCFARALPTTLPPYIVFLRRTPIPHSCSARSIAPRRD